MPKFAVILPAAGRSSRFRDPLRKKPFVELRGRPVWVRSLEPFTNHPDVTQLMVVVSPEEMEEFRDKFRPNLAFMNVEVVAGGAERADSVQNALARVRSDVDFVAVHDAARPLLTKAWVDAVFSAAIKTGAAIPAIPISSTIKRVRQNLIEETVPRENLWQAQTPQVFDVKLLREAFAKRGDFAATDEAQLVERLGHAVTIVEGSPVNIKITTQEDLKLAGLLLAALPQERTAAQMHPFAADNPHLFDSL